MADHNNPHFDKLYWFCVMVILIGFSYIVAVTFLKIPEENQRTVDTTTGFVLGSMVSAAIGYLLGGNPKTHERTPIIPENSDTNINIQSKTNGDAT